MSRVIIGQPAKNKALAVQPQNLRRNRPFPHLFLSFFEAVLLYTRTRFYTMNNPAL